MTEEGRFERYTANDFSLRPCIPKLSGLSRLVPKHNSHHSKDSKHIPYHGYTVIYGPKTTFGNQVVNSGNAATMNRAAT